MIMSSVSKIKQMIKNAPGMDYFLWTRSLYQRNRSVSHTSALQFYINNISNIKLIPLNGSKGKQFLKLANTVNINPAPSDWFFYSFDEYVAPKTKERILDNMTVDYSIAINSFIDKSKLGTSSFAADEKCVIDGLKRYLKRIQQDENIARQYKTQIAEINSLFERPAEDFHEALQRILFVNQWMWQTGHYDNGLGHLDWLLEDLYDKEINKGTKKEFIFSMLKDFFTVLHEFYWAKSANLPGDIGQIIILGGVDASGEYHYNELTYMFLECAKDLKLPDPKVLLRISNKTPEDLFDVAIDCLSTGIGGPVFSNDDVVVPKLVEFGFTMEQASEYITSACWEPMVINGAIEQNNIGWINFAMPLCKILSSSGNSIASFEVFLNEYKKLLEEQIEVLLRNLDNKMFEQDPFVSLFYGNCIEENKDISEGGGNQFNLGITGVGMSTAVNSLMNIKHLVFEDKNYTFEEIISACQNNFEGCEELRRELEYADIRYGQDVDEVVDLTNDLMYFTSHIISPHRTRYGGRYKFGLSSPRYIMESKHFPATPDGRKNGEPFDVHISGKNGITPVELMLFASRLDYGENRFNANVVDFILQPQLFEHKEKLRSLIRGGLSEGVFQIQINVVSSQTLIDAQKHPDNYKSLVVRVWGFSAYFVELPKEYQDNLIRRALESERISA